MTVYVMRNGRIVTKEHAETAEIHATISARLRADFPAPNVSRFDAMQSPVTGKEITSWRDRDRDMAAVGAVDPRDLSRKPFEKRAAYAARQSEPDA